MHELLAVILMVVDRDSLSPSPRAESGMYSPLTTETPQDPAELILARRWVEHDTFALYNALMGGAKKWYEWRSETEGGGRGVAGKSPRRQAKIIEICNAVQGMIKGVDPILNGRLEAEGVEGQIWAM
jgi:TBC1 domain family member 5